ncbi:MAG: hypothetical protein KDC57_05165 [Saprospiraceae bacterium]|nr:hypothetical protein [Saprospiraceae bacterium]
MQRGLDSTDRNNRLAMAVVAAGLLVYVFWRAAALSMTHDEAHTYLAFHNVSVWSCFWSSDCWENANNHLLNTLLMQWSVTMFGPKEWAIRLPNVMAFALYVGVVLRMLFYLARGKPLLQWLGFSLMVANPYLLDFFGLARGYGLSVSCLLVALWHFLRWLEQGHLRRITWSYCWLGLAVLSNFTALNFLAAFMISHAVTGLVILSGEADRTWRSLFFSALPGIVLLALLAIFLALPIRILKAQGEFLYGASSLWDTLSILVSDTLYSQHYLGSSTEKVGLVLFLIWITPALAFGLGGYMVVKNTARRFHLAVSLLLLSSLGIMLLQHLFLGSQFLFNRKALMYIPLFALVSWLFIHAQWEKQWMRITGTVIAGFFAYHLLRTANLHSCREWWYDADTKTMMRSLEEVTRNDPKPVSLGLNWLFMPSAEYYRTVNHLDFLEPLIYDKTIQSDGRFDYYYIDVADWVELEGNYEKIQDYGSRFLLRKK